MIKVIVVFYSVYKRVGNSKMAAIYSNGGNRWIFLASILLKEMRYLYKISMEIVYKGQNIRGTNIVDLSQYCVTPYHSYIPEPVGLQIFLKGLAKLEIDKSIIVNGRVIQC